MSIDLKSNGSISFIYYLLSMVYFLLSITS